MDCFEKTTEKSRKRNEPEAPLCVDEDAVCERPQKIIRTSDDQLSIIKTDVERDPGHSGWIYLETGDARQAFEAMSPKHHIEHGLLRALAQGLQPLDALHSLPRSVVTLYVHAAQSVVWNTVLSKRIHQFGTKPIIGDLMFTDDVNPSGQVEDEHVCDEFFEGKDDGSEVEDDSAKDTPKSLPTVHVSTESNILATDLSNIILPLPGQAVQYPAYLNDLYEKVVLETLGLSLKCFSSRNPLVNARGAYRRMVVIPKDLTWQVVQPSEVRVNMLENDVGKLLADVARQLPERNADEGMEEDDRNNVTDNNENGRASMSESHAAEPFPLRNAGESIEEDDENIPTENTSEAELAAVILSCVLPSSAYLTMLMWELTKQSTARNCL